MKSVAVLSAMIVSLTVAATPVQHLAADLPVVAPAAEPPFQNYGDRDKSCLAWTDDCRSCTRTESEVTCSNIGIACQPGKIRCTARQQRKNP